MPTDRQAQLSKERQRNAQVAERSYAATLRKVAKHIGDIVSGHGADYLDMMSTLRRYGEILRPWARAVGKRMIADVARRDTASWKRHSQAMGKALRQEFSHGPIGAVLRERLDAQVDLITSLPTEAAQRVHKLTVEARVSGVRAKSLARQIKETGPVTASRAMLIARTEVSRTAATLTMERAKLAGSVGYIWRTAKDSDVRDSHRKMEGRYVRYDENGGEGAALSDGTTTHAGCIYNCRCYPEPIFPEEL